MERNERISLPYTVPEISLVSILNGGKDIITELVAKWLASSAMDPAKFFKSIDNVSPEEEALASPELYLLRKHFPFSLVSGALLAHLSWEFMSAWNENVQELDLFTVTLECLDTFAEADFAIHHGIGCKIWNHFVRQAYIRSMKMVNRVDDGRASSAHGFTDVMVSSIVNGLAQFDKFPLSFT